MKAFRLALCFALMLAGTVGACSEEDVERRARRAAEKMRESIPDVHAEAMEQDVSADTVREAQQALTVLKEYMGEVNGKLDPVTINAVQAFQRSQGFADDGILDKKTMRALQEAARAAGAAPKSQG
jgi:peptidoglycan hydrolase-like protein with peptidoglycan-binding domain